MVMGGATRVIYIVITVILASERGEIPMKAEGGFI